MLHLQDCVSCVVGMARQLDSKVFAIETQAFLKALGDMLLICMLIHSSCHMLSPRVGGLALELLDCLKKTHSSDHQKSCTIKTCHAAIS